MKRFSRILCIILTVLAISCQKEKEPEIVKVTGVTLNSTSFTLTEGESQTLSATVSPQDAANKKVIWSTSNASVASVDNGGKVTASAAGSATITVTTDDGGKTATCTVTVKAAVVPVSSVALDKTELTLTIGDPDVKLVATVTPDNATDKTVSWSSDKTDVATVDTEGSVHAVAPGTATITVTTTDGGKTATCAVTIKIKALPDDALKGEFSVSATKKVHFSKGNLVATIKASGTPTAWKFAANQYDCLGEGGANKTIGSTAGDIDLFGWSTASTTYGISTSTTNSDYSGDFVDWGKAYCEKNSITPDNTWRTLKMAEWYYLFYDRTGAASKVGYATVGGVEGIIILPDSFTDPKKNNGSDEFVPESSTGWDKNVYTSGVNWNAMEAAGAVFLPAAGYRYGSHVYDVGFIGYYWSSTALVSSNANGVYFRYSDVLPGISEGRRLGYSVRLITESN